MNWLGKIIVKFIFLFPTWAGSLQYPVEPQAPEYEILQDSLYKKSNKYQKDFLYLCYALEEAHANPYLNYDKEKYGSDKEHLYNELGKCKNRQQFAFHVQPFLAKLKDGHTSLQTLNVAWSFRKIYPVMYSWFGEELYVSSCSPKHINENILGKKIESINGYSINELKDKILPYSSNENEIGGKQEMTYLLILADFLEIVGIVDNSKKMNIKTSDNETFILKPVHGIDLELKNLKGADHKITHERNSNDYLMLDSIKTCYFQFNTMMGRSMEKFTPLLSDMFTEMENKNVENLIVDLRYNGGGNSNYGEQLLYLLDVPDERLDFSTETKVSELLKMAYPDYISEIDSLYKNKFGKELQNKVYKNLWSAVSEKDSITMCEDTESNYFVHDSIPHFNGNVYFITGRKTYSSANFLATIIKDNGFFPVIGELNAQKPSSFGDKILVKLPNTKMAASISFKYFERPDSTKSKEAYMYPDYQIDISYDDFKNGNDPLFEKVREMISDK